MKDCNDCNHMEGTQVFGNLLRCNACGIVLEEKQERTFTEAEVRAAVEAEPADVGLRVSLSTSDFALSIITHYRDDLLARLGLKGK